MGYPDRLPNGTEVWVGDDGSVTPLDPNRPGAQPAGGGGAPATGGSVSAADQAAWLRNIGRSDLAGWLSTFVAQKGRLPSSLAEVPGGGGGAAGATGAYNWGGLGSAMTDSNQQRFDWEKESFMKQFGLNERQFEEMVRQFNVSNEFEQQRWADQMGLDRDKFGEMKRQFDMSFGENARQFDATFGENQRQFNQSQFSDMAQSLLSAATELDGPADWLNYQTAIHGGRNIMDMLKGGDAAAAFGAAGYTEPNSVENLLRQLGLISGQSAGGGSTNGGDSGGTRDIDTNAPPQMRQQLEDAYGRMSGGSTPPTSFEDEWLRNVVAGGDIAMPDGASNVYNGPRAPMAPRPTPLPTINGNLPGSSTNGPNPPGFGYQGQPLGPGIPLPTAPALGSSGGSSGGSTNGVAKAMLEAVKPVTGGASSVGAGSAPNPYIGTYNPNSFSGGQTMIGSSQQSLLPGEINPNGQLGQGTPLPQAPSSSREYGIGEVSRESPSYTRWVGSSGGQQAPTQQSNPYEVALPWQVHPAVWDSMSASAKQMILASAAKGNTKTGYWSPEDYQNQLNAARPIGSAPRRTSMSWGNNQGLY